jgi:hypothetical protein
MKPDAGGSVFRWLGPVLIGKSRFDHHEGKKKRKIGIIVHVGALMDLTVLRSAGFSGCVAWKKPWPSISTH